MLDPATEVGVAVEEGVGDAGFTLDSLKGDRLAALDQGADALFGGFGLRRGFGLRGGGQHGDALGPGVGHRWFLRWGARFRVSGTALVEAAPQPPPWTARPG